MPEVSVAECVPGPRKVQSTVAPGAALSVAGTGREARISALVAVGMRRAMWLAKNSLNHRLRSAPTGRPSGPDVALGAGDSVIVPAVVIRPIFAPLDSVNQRFPSGPAAIPGGWVAGVTANSVIVPAVVIRPIFSPLDSVNHRFPSGPAAIPCGTAVGVG